MERLPKLLSSEVAALKRYLDMTTAERESTLQAAIREPKTSGPLIMAYRTLQGV